MQVMSNISASIIQRKVGIMESSCKFQPAIIRFSHLSVISKYKAKQNHNLQSLSRSLRLQNTDSTDKNMIVCCSVGAGPSSPDPSSWKIWVVGILMSIILPFWRSKWGPLLKLKDEVQSVIEKVETVADIVEKVAEQVEEVADDIGNHMPEGKLKEALEMIEDMADHTADGARLAGEFIDKVEEVEEKVESWMEQNSIGEEVKKSKEEDEEAAEGQI